MQAPSQQRGGLRGAARTAAGPDLFCIEWNPENQLTRVTKNSSEQARFKYDPLGRRVEKVAGGVTTAWTYDGEDILRETNGSTTLKYVHGDGTDEPVAVDDGSALAYFQADGLGSVLKNTNAAGSVILTRQYDAWGNLQAGGTTSGDAFTGREWDPETGLAYYRARYYDAQEGRFLGEDPIGLVGGLNVYAYVDNRPVSDVDPLGLSPWRAAREAARRAEAMRPHSAWNGPGDAIRHCIWSCIMTYENGDFVASLAGWVREKSHDWSPNHPQEDGEREMDDRNNACGRNAGATSTSPEECAVACHLDMVRGNLTRSYVRHSTPPYHSYGQ